MKTMSGSVSGLPPPLLLTHNFDLCLALLYRTRSIPAELQLQDRHLVPWCGPVHHALRQGALPRQLRARDHWKCHQGRLPF